MGILFRGGYELRKYGICKTICFQWIFNLYRYPLFHSQLVFASKRQCTFWKIDWKKKLKPIESRRYSTGLHFWRLTLTNFSFTCCRSLSVKKEGRYTVLIVVVLDCPFVHICNNIFNLPKYVFTAQHCSWDFSTGLYWFRNLNVEL